MTAVAPSIGTKHPPLSGSNARAVATLRDLGMPRAEIDAILESDDPRLVGRYLQLHAERLEERLADQRSLLLSIEPILGADPTDRGGSPPPPGVLASNGRGRAGSGRPSLNRSEEIPLTQTPSDATERLEALVGRWHTEGWTRDEAGHAPERIDATDTYEWLPGRASLLHLVDATVGGTKVEGAEIIGYDADRGHYTTLYFGTDGHTAYEADLTETDGLLVWEMRSADSRFRGSFDAHRGLITGHWELLIADSGWRPWMDITLTKQAS